jgi:hypothetical protein
VIGQTRFRFLVLLLFVLALGSLPELPNSQLRAATNGSGAMEPFLGRWDITIRMGGRERPSWIDVSSKQGQPAIWMVGLSGNANPLPKVQIHDGAIEFLSPKGGEGFANDTLFKGKRAGSRLDGTATAPDGKSWPWIGVRAPALKREGTFSWGKPIRLFDGRDLTGWRFADPSHAGIWSVQDGTLVKNGIGSELISTSKFEDFKLHVEFNCGPEANSGVYLRGRYEVQIETNSPTLPPNGRIGAIYGFLAPHPPLPRTPGVWRTYDITLLGRTVTLVHDGQTVIDHREIPGITGGALDSHEGLPGPIYLQGSEEGRVAFRNIVITPAEW